MAQSENSWPLVNSSQLDNSPFPGTNVVPLPGVLRGDVATVLLHVGKLFNERVAQLYNPGCWGWNNAGVIPGTNVYGNHSSGTAIDLNAPSFPWKIRRMTQAQINACHSIVEDMEGVVRWGGDYTTYVDQMHFEINANADEVRNLANKIKGGNIVMVDEFTCRWIIEQTTGRGPIGSELADRVGKYTPAYVINEYINSAAGVAFRQQRDLAWKSQQDTITSLQKQLESTESGAKPLEDGLYMVGSKKK